MRDHQARRDINHGMLRKQAEAEKEVMEVRRASFNRQVQNTRCQPLFIQIVQILKIQVQDRDLEEDT